MYNPDTDRIYIFYLFLTQREKYFIVANSLYSRNV